MTDVVLGGGMAGLLAARMLDSDCVVIAKQVSNGREGGLHYIHHDTEFSKFLRRFSSLEPVELSGGVYMGGQLYDFPGFADKLDISDVTAIAKSYLVKSRGDEFVEPSEETMNGLLAHRLGITSGDSCSGYKWSPELAGSLSKGLWIEQQEVRLVDVAKRIVHTDTSSIAYDRLVVTIPLPVFCRTVGVAPCRLQAYGEYVRVFKSNGDRLPYDYVYFPFEPAGAHRMYFTDGIIGVEQHTNSDILGPLVRKYIKEPIGLHHIENAHVVATPLQHQRISDFAKTFERRGVYFVGRFAQWKHMRLHDVYYRMKEVLKW